MHVLALNPFHGGSHRAFLDGWREHSVHEFTMMTLPDRHWKWRMRSAAIAFAAALAGRPDSGRPFDLLFVTDMLNLAELRGLCEPDVARLPAVLYFHENQLTYPSREPIAQRERDLHFAFTNVISALAADEIWFNSMFHRDTFLGAIETLNRQMPEATLGSAAEFIRHRSSVCPPGIESFAERPVTRSTGPLHVLWAARWEHDKNPDLLFEALRLAADQGCDFRLSVIGQSYSDVPACFEDARRRWKSRIIHWGYLPDRTEYQHVLSTVDVFVSTANHEFFGIAAAEAIAAGCYPLLPDRLAYPELVEGRQEYLYPGDAASLSSRLQELADRHRVAGRLRLEAAPAHRAVSRFRWPRIAATMDARLEAVVRSTRPHSTGSSRL